MVTPKRPRPSAAAARPSAPVPPVSPAVDEVLLFTPAEAAGRLQVRESWLRKKAAASHVTPTMQHRITQALQHRWQNTQPHPANRPRHLHAA